MHQRHFSVLQRTASLWLRELRKKEKNVFWLKIGLPRWNLKFRSKMGRSYSRSSLLGSCIISFFVGSFYFFRKIEKFEIWKIFDNMHYNFWNRKFTLQILWIENTFQISFCCSNIFFSKFCVIFKIFFSYFSTFCIAFSSCCYRINFWLRYLEEIGPFQGVALFTILL